MFNTFIGKAIGEFCFRGLTMYCCWLRNNIVFAIICVEMLHVYLKI